MMFTKLRQMEGKKNYSPRLLSELTTINITRNAQMILGVPI